MRDAVWVLQMKTTRQKNWTPVDVFSGLKGAEKARQYHQKTYPKLMHRVKMFTAGRG